MMGGTLAALFFSSYYFLSPPPNFPSGDILVIKQGASAIGVAQELADAHIIAYPIALRLILSLSGESGNIQAGAYRFSVPENLFAIAHRITTGTYGLPLVHITFPEGTTVRNMAMRVATVFPEITASNFLSVAQPYEGYLFPDTYFFPPSADAKSLVATMRAEFNTKIAQLSNQINLSGHSLSDIVIMASLIEKEARTSVDRRIVAGILWNRIQRGMPLQVDAVFGYIYNRSTYAPSLADLKVNSLYNTYIHKGLPPGPIDNPGLGSIEAAMDPMKTNYLYYLTDKNGVMHYATTYAQHQANLRKYLH